MTVGGYARLRESAEFCVLHDMTGRVLCVTNEDREGPGKGGQGMESTFGIGIKLHNNFL